MYVSRSVRIIVYLAPFILTGLSLFLRWPFWPALGSGSPFLTFIPAVMLSAFVGGLWPGLLTTFLSALAADYFLMDPPYSLRIANIHDAIALTLFVVSGTVISALSEALHRSRRRVLADQRRYAVTLSSIGDAVVATDKQGRVTFMNPVAERLTGWPQRDAAGRPLAEVFRVIDEQTRQPLEDPGARMLRPGVVDGPGKHAVLLARDGREVPIEESAGPAIEDSGRITGVVVIFRDISQRRKAEEAELVRRAHHPLKLAVRGSNINIWEIDMPDGVLENGRLTLATFWEQLGYESSDSPTELATAATFVSPSDRPRLEKAMRSYLAGETGEFEVEVRSRHKDGSYRWMLMRGVAVRDADGKPIRFVGCGVDITDRKRTEEALRASEHRFRTFVDHATDAFFLFDNENAVLDVNRRACESLGYTRDELLGMTPIDFDADITPAALNEIMRKLRDGELLAFEARHRRKDGSVFPVEIRGQAFWEGGQRYFVSLARDMTDRKRTEEALRESEGRWRILTESLPQLVWAAAPDGACVYFSTQWSDHTGVPESQLLGWQWLDVLHPDDREPTRRFWTDSLAGRSPYDVEYRVRRWDGEYRWFKTRGVPIRNSNGDIREWFGTCTDITDLRQTEEALRASEERFRGTFENAAVGIAHCDLEGRYLRVNQKYGDIVGFSREELLRMSFKELTLPEDLPASLAKFTPLLRGELSSYQEEKRVMRKDGSRVWVSLFVSLQRDAVGEPIHSIGILEDISERKRLVTEIRDAKEVAEAANRAKDEFLANVSHEIRTPMNAILGMTELVLDTALTDEQRQCLRTVKSAADNLLGIINDLLDFSKIEAGKLELYSTDFSLRTVIGDTLRALAVRAHAAGLELIYHVQPEAPDYLIGDAGRLRQVLLNLVGNALKFTEAGEVVVRVENAVEPAPEGEIGLRFAVSDTGIGIPPDKQESIFRAFEQEDTSTTRKYGGTGLGLTIAARLVALMGGQISVNSAPGRGSTFTFTARFGLQPHPAGPLVAQPPVLLRNLPVLIVDDNASNRHILEEWLRSWEMEPAAAGDGVAAMDALWEAVTRGRPYALVLLDARMPDTDGLALAVQIRKRAELSATRLILLTSGDRPGDRARTRELRIDAHLLKPIQQEELLETIYQVMSRGKGDEAQVARDATARGRDPAPVTTGKALDILVAEDNEFSARLMEQLLSRGGHRVRLATTGPEALALAEGGDFDLVFLDIHMPGLDGFAVVAAIRKSEKATGAHLPIIALTARSRKEDRERCLAAGMDDFLTKPVPASALFAAIDRLATLPGVSRPANADNVERGSLLDPVAVLTACGNDAEGLRMMCRDFKNYAPVQMAEVGDAMRQRDALRLRLAAHKICPLLLAFSTAAGNVASELEDLAGQDRLEDARPLVKRLETMTAELLQLVGDLSIETLRQQANAARNRQSAEP
jgi:PAS domain S-box-containing protein